MRLAIKDKRVAGFRFVDARCGISNDSAAARRLPDCLAGPAVHRDNRALASARVRGGALDEFLVVLKIGQNNLVIAHNGGGAAAMLAHKRAEVSLPNNLAFMIQSGQKVMIWFIPHDINAVAIHCRSGGGIAIELVSRKG